MRKECLLIILAALSSFSFKFVISSQNRKNFLTIFNKINTVDSFSKTTNEELSKNLIPYSAGGI